MAGHDVIADVAALALQGRGQVVADDDRAQVLAPPRTRAPSPGPPQLADGAAALDEAGEVGSCLLELVGGLSFLDGGLGLTSQVGVPDHGGRRNEACHAMSMTATAHGAGRNAAMLGVPPAASVELATGCARSWSWSPSPNGDSAPAPRRRPRWWTRRWVAEVEPAGVSQPWRYVPLIPYGWGYRPPGPPRQCSLLNECSSPMTTSSENDKGRHRSCVA